jgi:hypothetical protein
MVKMVVCRQNALTGFLKNGVPKRIDAPSAGFLEHLFARPPDALSGKNRQEN